MKKYLVFFVCALSFVVASASALAMVDSSYHFKNGLGLSDVNVINSLSAADANLVEVSGHYNAWFSDGRASGHLKVATVAADGSHYDLRVKWSSREDYGITITQNDQYAVKFIANAKVIRNGQVQYNQPVYVHYSKISNSLVVRGNGFRIATNTPVPTVVGQ